MIMVDTQNNPFDSIEVVWTTPTEIAADGATKWSRIRIYRSGCESSGYVQVAEIDSQSGSTWVTFWHDTEYSPAVKDELYYVIRYYDHANFIESKFYLTSKTATPREQRLIGMVRCILTPFISTCLTDDDVRAGIVLGLNSFNIYPPITNFTLHNLPTALEPVVTTGAAIFSLMYRYLGVAFTDVSYSDMGLSLTIDRGSKVKNAVDTLMGYYNQMISLVKLEYSFMGTGIGTLQLPYSLGSNLNRGLLNALDIFTSIGR